MRTTNYQRLALVPSPELLARFVFDGSAVYQIINRQRRVLTKLANGQVYVTLQGSRILAHDIAWALTYGNWPIYPLWHKDGEPWNLAIANLLPVRTKSLRCRITDKAGQYFRHPLSERFFPSKAAAEKAWRELVNQTYQADLDFCLTQEKLARGDSEEVEIPRVKVPFVLAEEVILPPIEPYLVSGRKKPKVALNARAHWRPELKSWLVVNAPAGVWDDYHIRCEAALRGLFPTEAG